jgi:branched-chain amino acid transport system substrate-binding protein
MSPLHLRRAAVAAALSLAVAAAAVPVRALATTSGAPVEIDVVLSTSGAGAFFGQAEARALKVVESTINAGSGVRGRPVAFTILDDQTNPQTAVQLVSGLAAKNVPLFLGPSVPASCFSVGPMIDKTGPVGLCLNPAGHPQPGSFQYTTFADSLGVASAFLTYFRERGLTRIALIDATDASGHDADIAFEAAFKLPENAKLVKVDEEHYAPGDISVSAQLERIKAANAQAIVSYNTGLPFGTVLRGMRDAGIDVPVATSGGNMTYGQMTTYAPFLPTEVLFGGTVAWSPGDARIAAVKQMQLAYVAALDKAGMKPEGGYATVWDPAILAVAVLSALGPDTDATKVRAYLTGLQGWSGIQGVYDFKRYPQRGVGAEAVLVMRWDATKKTFVAAGRAPGVALR